MKVRVERMERRTFACVLRSGGDFDPSWVRALKVGVDEHGYFDRFVCLTNMEFRAPGVTRKPMEHAWPGWWSKMELFRPDLFPRGELVVYADLDTLVIGDLYDLCHFPGEFGMIRGFYHDVWQSGVMAWRPGGITDRMWETWSGGPDRWMKKFRGDGRWLDAHVPKRRATQLIDAYPGMIVSYKVDCKEERPDGPAIVCGHGRPRFSDPAAKWAHELWKRRRDGRT